jgi:hypothetical protein
VTEGDSGWGNSVSCLWVAFNGLDPKESRHLESNTQGEGKVGF